VNHKSIVRLYITLIPSLSVRILSWLVDNAFVRCRCLQITRPLVFTRHCHFFSLSFTRRVIYAAARSEGARFNSIQASTQHWLLPSDPKTLHTTIDTHRHIGLIDTVALDLTFGIEFEFLLILDKVRPIGDARADLLSQPIIDHCSLPGCQTKHTLTLEVTTQENDPESWSVGYDISLRLSAAQQNAYRHVTADTEILQCEVRSPAFTYKTHLPDQPSAPLPHNHKPLTTPEWEIHHALRMINAVNEPVKQRGWLRTFANTTCGLHVHVGSGLPSAGFTMQTVRNVLSLATAFERQIDSMHAVSRIGGSSLSLRGLSTSPGSQLERIRMPRRVAKLYGPSAATTDAMDGTSEFCLPLSQVHAYRTYFSQELDQQGPAAYHIPGNPREPGCTLSGCNRNLHDQWYSMDACNWHYVVQEARTMQGLLDLFGPANLKSTNVSIFALQPSRRGTIEFRQHVGTLDFHETMAWVNAVVSMVQYCNDTDARDFGGLVCEYWSDPEYFSTDLLRTVGAPQSALAYYTRIRNTDGHFFRDRYDAALQRENAHPTGEGFGPLVRMVERARLRDNDAAKVKARIRAKWEAGGYGRGILIPYSDDEMEDV